MNLIGKSVSHKVFGIGTIIDQTDAHIVVSFNANSTQKKFSYPQCFKTFLQLQDSDVAAQVNTVMEEHDKKEQARQEQEKSERLASLYTARSTSNKSIKGIDIPTFASISEFCNSYRDSLIREISYLKNTGGKHQKVFDGKLVEIKGGRWIYVFDTEDELSYPEGTSINVWDRESSTPATVLACEDFLIYISIGVDLGKEVPVLEFSAEPWHLIQWLINRLDELQTNPSPIVRTLISEGKKNIEASNPNITRGQDTAVRLSASQPITFVWGPPGTGKTETLAKIALEHIRRGHRVLMLSYSNVSVDGAIMRVFDRAADKKPGLYVRYGYPRQKAVLDHQYITTYNLAILQHPDLIRERKSLLEERRRLMKNSPRYLQIGQRLSAIRNALSEDEKKAVKTAKFVATTVSKAIVDETVYKTPFDIVIFDEASMAYIPQIIFAASIAKQHFVCMGDFRQLPPIVQSSSDSILNADIFQYCGIVAAVDGGRNHKWICMLSEQHRMHPDIAAFASRSMYRGLLTSASGMQQNRQSIANTAPIPRKAIGFIDLSGMMSTCTKSADGSRINVLSALIAASRAIQAAKHYEVGIITPYHAQSRLLHAMARDIAESNGSLKPISCATVHQFQGSEKDVILYDAVDCYRMPYPGMLLTTTGNNYANRLFNVALTRAKGKFIAIANIDYMQNKHLSPNLMFGQLIQQQQYSDSCMKREKCPAEANALSNSICMVYPGTTGNQPFLNDIAAARTEIRIDIPGQPSANYPYAKLAYALQAAKAKGIKVIIRAEFKKNIPTELRPMTIENPFVANPIAMIDKRVVWYGQPASAAQFITEGTHLPTAAYPVIRFQGSHTAKSLYGFLEMNRTTDQSTTVEIDPDGNANTDVFSSYVIAHEKCRSCGKPMKLTKSKRGKFFLSCTGYPRCNETKWVTAELVEDYFYRNSPNGQRCTKCNCSLEAKVGPYGLYIQCCNYQPHRFKLDEI